MTKKLIYLEDAVDALNVGAESLRRVSDDADVVGVERKKYEWGLGLIESCISDMKELPSAQPEVIRCKDCKHWTQSMGKMKGYGLGRCDFHDADLVTCNGYCYWAERRTDG